MSNESPGTRALNQPMRAQGVTSDISFLLRDVGRFQLKSPSCCSWGKRRRTTNGGKKKHREPGDNSPQIKSEHIAGWVHGLPAPEWLWYRSQWSSFPGLEDGGRLPRVPVFSGRPDVQQQTAHQHAHHPGRGKPTLRQGYRRNYWSSNKQGFYKYRILKFQLFLSMYVEVEGPGHDGGKRHTDTLHSFVVVTVWFYFNYTEMCWQNDNVLPKHSHNKKYHDSLT